MSMAHEQDITLNQLVAKVIQQVVDKHTVAE
jgi:predicted HicB family RNase H-like nuclease